jgi:hypothetical protein
MPTKQESGWIEERRLALTIQVAIAGAVIAVVVGVIGVAAWSWQKAEARRSLDLSRIEELRTKANLELEKSRQLAAEALERKKFQTALILEVIKGSASEAIRNLKFFVDAGFVEDPEGRIAKLSEARVQSMVAGPSQGAPAPQILRFIEGVDSAPTPMSADDMAAQLNDPWGALVLRKQEKFPANLKEVLSVAPLPNQSSFFVSETGQIPVDAANATLQREFRLVVSRTQPGNASIILVSAPAGSREGFTELMSWDTTKQAFNFYRRQDGNQWFWRGDTRDALQSASAGKGCFLCHVHGAPIMKELREPWNNWHSQSSPIPPEAIPTKELRDDPLFQRPPDGTKKNGEELEHTVRGWTSMAMTARVKAAMRGTVLTDARALLRPLFETTAVNLSTSMDISDRTTDRPTMDLPVNFFINSDVLSGVLRIKIALKPSVKREFYQASLTAFNFRLEDGTFVRKGDTHFGFLVPEPSVGDTETIRQLILQKVVSARFATCVLLVDFPNPIYSAARARLLQYVPAEASIDNGSTDVENRTADAIVAAAANQPDGSPEKLFAANWNKTPDQLRTDAEQMVRNYLQSVQDNLGKPEGFYAYTRLAQSRRDRFARSALNEFPLLLPKNDISTLHIEADGLVRP